MKSRSIADTLRGLLSEASPARVSVQWLLSALSKRAFGFLLLVLALPNLIPMPPGASIVLGALLMFPSVQMMFGRAEPWLPRRVAHYQLQSATVRTVIDKSAPWLDRIQPLTHERLVFLTEGASIQILGALCLCLALVLMLPIVFAHFFPGVALCLIAIGLIERDGVFVLLSAPFVAASFLVVFFDLTLLAMIARPLGRLFGLQL